LILTNENWQILATALIISVSGILTNVIKVSTQKQQNEGTKDKTLSYFRFFIPISIITSLILYWSGWLKYDISKTVYLFALMLVISGLAIRYFAIMTLGSAFTVKIEIIKEHKLKTNGLYQRVRHPSYTGLLQYYVGLGLMMHNLASLLILTVIPLWVVLVRIEKEEKLLKNHFGEPYLKYQSISHKLFPYIY